MTSNDGHLGGALASVYDDPMAKVLGLDSESSGTAMWAGYYVGALALMLGMGFAAHAIAIFIESTNPRVAATVPQEIDVQQEMAPPPPPPPPPKADDKPLEAPRPTPREAPPPAPAQAGKVLTREADPNEPVDLTGDTIVTGNADAYIGGATASNGTAKTAVHGPAQVEVPAPSAARAPSPVDRSRPARLTSGSDWNDCGFPEEANALQIDESSVTIQVDVRADGSKDVRVTSDPGHGFGQLARSCALRKTFEPALDHDGNPIASTKPIRIHFSR